MDCRTFVALRYERWFALWLLDQTAEQLEQALREALRADDGVLVVHADKGRRLLLPAGQIGYLDLGAEHARPVGFGFESD